LTDSLIDDLLDKRCDVWNECRIIWNSSILKSSTPIYSSKPLLDGSGSSLEVSPIMMMMGPLETLALLPDEERSFHVSRVHVLGAREVFTVVEVHGSRSSRRETNVF
jgi:hypothetical protein